MPMWHTHSLIFKDILVKLTHDSPFKKQKNKINLNKKLNSTQKPKTTVLGKIENMYTQKPLLRVCDPLSPSSLAIDFLWNQLQMNFSPSSQL